MGMLPDPARRSRLRVLVVGAAALTLLLTTVAPSAATGPGPVKGNVVTVGSHYSEDPDLTGFASMMSYCNRAAGTATEIQQYPWDDFQNNFEAYLRGTPQTVVTWFAGERMRYFAAKGLLTPINDVWTTIGGRYTPAMKALSTGLDGQQYFVPLFDYPWAVMYRKSVFAEHGYTIPKTMPEFLALAAKMQDDGFDVPLVLGDADGWEAMGIFDILDMRLNGFDFHMGLMAGTQDWTDARVKAVFQIWRSLLPYMSPDATTRGWWDAAADLMSGAAGMDFIGSFGSWAAPDEATYADLDMFPFPVLGTAYDAEMAIDAPVDGLALSTNTTNLFGAKQVLACAASGPAQLKFLADDPGYVAAARTTSTAKYWPFQKRMDAVIASANKVAQFMDRDSRPDFVGPGGMQAFLTSFLETPGQDLDLYLADIQAYWDALPPAP